MKRDSGDMDHMNRVVNFILVAFASMAIVTGLAGVASREGDRTPAPTRIEAGR